MTSRNALSLMFFVCFMMWNYVPTRASDMSAEQLIAEVVKSHRQLREAFRPTKVVYSLTEQPTPDANRTGSTVELLYSDGNILAKTLADDTTTIQCRNHDYQFEIERPAADASWTIDRIQKTTSSNADSMIVLVLQEDPLSGVLFANHISIDDLLTNPDTRVVSLEETKSEGDSAQRSLELSISLNPEAKTEGTEFSFNFSKAKLTFTPDIADWIPTRVELEAPSGNRLTFVNEGFVTHGAYKVPTHCTQFERLPEGDDWVCSQRENEYTFDDLPSETFRLSHYGLPEPKLEGGLSRYRLMALASAVVVLLLSVCVLLFRRGKKIA